MAINARRIDLILKDFKLPINCKIKCYVLWAPLSKIEWHKHILSFIDNIKLIQKGI
jgi:hypothetical protein